MKIKNVVVIGSGTMGSGIAAHLCNANIPVTLLDLKTEISEKARERIHKSRPPLLIDKSKINNIKVGNISDDFDVVKDADWIVEAVVERIDVKHQIYKKIFKTRKDGAIVSSNTSSIPIKVLSEHLTDIEKKDFCITHFFNPVRYMGLLEIVKNENNDLNKINQLKEFCEVELGKGAIICNDTPGFLGNRVGVYAMQVAMTEAFKMKLSVEEADAIFGRPMGIPKTGVFGLYDLIGIDLMADVLKSFIKELPKSDEFHEVAKEIPLVKKLIETGYTGRKGKGGFYRINKTGATKVMEAINLETGDYSPSKKIDVKSDKVDLQALINRKDKYGEYAWSVLSKIIKYASSLIPNITKEFNDIDEAMRLGFNWAKGPFEMLEEIGVKNFFNRVDDFTGNSFLEDLSKTKNSEHLTDIEKKDFCITHFFNPVRYMGLLEIVKNENNDLKKINQLKEFCEIELGKGAIVCNDTPGFLGNRVGVYAMQVAMTEAFKMKLSVEEADAIFGRPMGIPKTGVFGLYDLIGIDLMADVLKSFIKELPKSDEFHEVAKEIPLVKKLIETGYTGRKGKGGFYRMNKTATSKVMEAINLESGNYFPSKKIDVKSDKVDLQGLINRKDKYGEYAWSVLSKIIKYASSLVPGITKEFNDIDEAMRLGFNWAKGPFEMLEEIGVKNFFDKIDEYKGNNFLEKLSKTKNEDFYGERQKYTNIETLGKVKKTASSLDGNDSAKIYRFNDYNIVEFTTKANALDYDSMDALKKATDKPLIIINESMQFSAGVNLTYTMQFADKKDFKSIEKFIKYFQETCKHLKYSKHPVISAPSGLTLGGGFEVMVQSNFVASHTNIVVGLVETIVGLIPAGGGCKEMLARWLDTDEAKKDPNYAPLKVFDIIGYGKTATSPVEAEPMKYLRPVDKKIMNRNSLLEVSKKILMENKDFKAPNEVKFNLPGKSVLEDMNKILDKLYNDKVILDHGVTVAKELAHVLSGGDTTIDKTLSEDDLFKLELDAFMRLIETQKTQDRIKHTLATGKPLVN